MVSTNLSREVNASVDRVLDIVSDLDNDPEYRKGLSFIRNIRKEGNLIEREIKVGFMGHESLQTIKLNP